jgi:DNA-directed RNA polymerase specialized sigma24 family protein
VFADAAAGLPDARAGDSPVLAWLYTVARRRFVDDLRRRGRYDLVADFLPTGPPGYGPFVARAVHEAIGRLPGGQSRVAVLKLLRGMSFAEIGTAVGLTEAATKTRFKQALEALRDELSEGGSSPERP